MPKICNPGTNRGSRRGGGCNEIEAIVCMKAKGNARSYIEKERRKELRSWFKKLAPVVHLILVPRGIK